MNAYTRLNRMLDGPPTQLGTCVHIKHGFAFRGEYFANEPTRDVLITPGNFAIGGGFNADKLKFYKGPVDNDFVLDPGDLVITMTDLSKAGDTLGFPAIIPYSERHRYLHNQRIGLVEIIDNDAIDKNFLFYLLRSGPYRHHILATASGSTVRHTSPGRIGEFEAVLPDLPEQRAIAELLGALDDKIEHNRRTAAKLEELARATFRAWFVDFAPVHAKAAGETAYPGLPPAAFAALPTSFIESPVGPIPERWDVKPLDEVAHFLNGLALQKYPPRDDGTDLPVIKIAQLRKGSTDGADRANESIDEKYKIEDRDLLFSWSGTLEATFWFGGPGALNQHLFKVTSETYPAWLVYEWIHQHLDEFRLIASSKATTMGHIKRSHLKQAAVAVPPPSFLKLANETLSPLYDLHANLQLESRQLAALRDYLLPRLLSGTVRVEGVSE